MSEIENAFIEILQSLKKDQCTQILKWLKYPTQHQFYIAALRHCPLRLIPSIIDNSAIYELDPSILIGLAQNSELTLEQKIKLLLKIDDFYKNHRISEDKYWPVLKKIGETILKTENLETIYQIQNCLIVSWAIVGNKNVPKKFALEIIEKTHQAFQKRTINIYTMSRLIYYAADRFHDQITPILLENKNLTYFFETIYPSIYPSIEGFTENNIKEIWTKHKGIQVTKYKNTSLEVLKNTWANNKKIESVTLGDQIFKTFDTDFEILILSYWNHPSCSDELFEEIWDKAHNEIRYHILLGTNNPPVTVVNKWLKKYAESLNQRYFGRTKWTGQAKEILENHIAAARLSM